jgi:hypothetical protein
MPPQIGAENSFGDRNNRNVIISDVAEVGGRRREQGL